MIFSSEECVVCLDGPANATFAPCRHRCTCDACASLIRQKDMDCPLCRTSITGLLQETEHMPSALDELEAFSKVRDEYIKKLHRPCAKNAGWTGSNKLSQGIGREMGDELAQRRLENTGSERMMNAKKATFKEDEDETLLVIDYKVGRRKLQETAPLIREWDQVLEQLRELLAGDVLSTLDLAIYYPEVFWLWKWHNRTEDDFQGLIGASKRIKTK